MAKFEVCSHKFADLSEHGYGVSILNDCKYGFATAGSLMRLSLLRSPKAPDAHADMGRHRIRYAILPHEGGLDARTVRAARAFNYPVQLYRSLEAEKKKASDEDDTEKLFRSIALSSGTAPSLILDTIKRGEDDEDVRHSSSQAPFPTDSGLKVRKGKSIILRIYESLGGKAKGSIATTLPVRKVWRCNLLEDDDEELEVRSREDGVVDWNGKGKGVEKEREKTAYVDFVARPFEVVTFRLQL